MKTLITEFISLDGVVQAPGAPSEDTDGGFAHGGWMGKYFDPEVMGGTFDTLAKQSDALLQGRRTYQVSAMAWPSRSGDDFSDWINRVQKYVVSDTLTEADITWHPTTIIRGKDFLKTVADLRAQPGGYIYVYGSPTMVQSLLAADLVDELVLTVVPLIIGSGKKLFPAMDEPLPFELVSAAKASTGAQVCRYVRAR
ncbi:dihydrofolate reductase family protein [Litorilinea aerophila]|uniref:Dihydrofolate reductase n=1 Tax=Litorilinea aerophila TaxID=1204385 RepID=A0A540VI56_9CHLR|nr:dihydrofolate reductase family protein [Litorilinea aerophila]MCC9076097.1 dihydrofolate reductase family protein [Litorilinea aerophila]